MGFISLFFHSGVAPFSRVVAAKMLVAAVLLLTPQAFADTFTYEGQITASEGALAVLIPLNSGLGGTVTITTNPGGTSTNPAHLTNTLLKITNPAGATLFCFFWNRTCAPGETLVPVVSIDAINLTFAANGCPIAGTIDITTFSPTFSVNIPVRLNITNKTLHAESPGLGSVDGVGDFTCMGEPEINTTPNPATPIDIGNVVIGTTGTAQTITINNIGDENLNIGAMSLTGSNPGDFSFTNTCTNMIIPAAGNCMFSVNSTPSSLGMRNAMLLIPSNDADEPTVTYNLAVTGTPAGQISTNQPLVIADTIEGDTSVGTVTVTNTGMGVLNISQIQAADLVAPFSFTTDTCSMAAIQAMDTCQIEVQFSPAAAGAFMDSFTIISDDPDAADASLVVNVMADSILREAILGATPNAVMFANITVNDVVTRLITVQNSGNDNLIISALNGLNAPYSVTGSAMTTCSINAPITPGSNCTIEIEFAPTTENTFSDTLSILSNDSTRPDITIALTGSATFAPTPNIVLSANSLNLGVVLVGSSATMSVTVSNDGNADLTVSAPTITPMGDFSAVNNCAIVIAGSTCTIDVTYTPGAEGADTATLSVESNDPETGAIPVSLSGVGVAPKPEISVSPPVSANLGSVVVGETSTADVVVTNEGSADLMIGMITISGMNSADFSQTNNCLTVLPGETCTITVTYAPAVDGSAEATLSIPSNDADEQIVDVALTGIATITLIPMISAPAAVDVGDVEVGMSGTVDIVVTNDGTADLTISDVAISGANAADFAISNDACSPAPVASMADCTITVSYNPTGEGASMATVTITSNDIANPMTDVAVTGTGIVVVAIGSIDISSLDFGGVPLGEASTQTLKITNSGNGVLMITGVSIAGADAASFSVPNVCATIAPASACNLVVSYAPTAGSSGGATLTITTNDPALASVAVQLSAAIEEVVVSVTSSAGKGSFGWLELMGLGLFVAWVRRRKLVPFLVVAGLVASSSAYAEEQSKSGYWYISAGSGSSTGQADEGNIQRAIESAGVSVTRLGVDDSDNGWKALVGYQASERLAIEVGYSDLGTAGVDLQLGSVSVAQLPLVSRVISNNLSLLGNGTHGSVVFKQPFKENLAVFARVGLMAWEIESSISGTAGSGSVNVRQVESGTDFMFGVGAEMWLEGSRFGLTVEWERYEFGRQDAELLTLNGKFRF